MFVIHKFNFFNFQALLKNSFYLKYLLKNKFPDWCCSFGSPCQCNELKSTFESHSNFSDCT